jgi:hypothetical protein
LKSLAPLGLDKDVLDIDLAFASLKPTLCLIFGCDERVTEKDCDTINACFRRMCCYLVEIKPLCTMSADFSKIDEPLEFVVFS